MAAPSSRLSTPSTSTTRSGLHPLCSASLPVFVDNHGTGQAQFPAAAGRCAAAAAADWSADEAQLNEFTHTGRRVDRPVRVEVNFSTVVDPGYSTVFTEEEAGPTPLVPVTIAYGAPNFNVTSVSCGLSRVVQENHARDMVLQDEKDELVRTRVLRYKASGAATFLERTAASKAAYLPPSSPQPDPDHRRRLRPPRRCARQRRAASAREPSTAWHPCQRRGEGRRA